MIQMQSPRGKKVFLKISQNSQLKNPLYNKVEGLRLATLLKNKAPAQVFCSALANF